MKSQLEELLKYVRQKAAGKRSQRIGTTCSLLQRSIDKDDPLLFLMEKAESDDKRTKGAASRILVVIEKKFDI